MVSLEASFHLHGHGDGHQWARTLCTFCKAAPRCQGDPAFSAQEFQSNSVVRLPAAVVLCGCCVRGPAAFGNMRCGGSLPLPPQRYPKPNTSTTRTSLNQTGTGWCLYLARLMPALGGIEPASSKAASLAAAARQPAGSQPGSQKQPGRQRGSRQQRVPSPPPYNTKMKSGRRRRDLSSATRSLF